MTPKEVTIKLQHQQMLLGLSNQINSIELCIEPSISSERMISCQVNFVDRRIGLHCGPISLSTKSVGYIKNSPWASPQHTILVDGVF